MNKGEKKNSDDLSQKMAGLCDVYVNDAFGTAHRAEATTYGIAKFAPIACAGPLMATELDALGKALGSPARPLVAIVGGAKVSGKLTILKTLADKVDNMIVGGGIANTFLQAAGYKIGKSLVEPELLDEAKTIMDMMAKRGCHRAVAGGCGVRKELCRKRACQRESSHGRRRRRHDSRYRPQIGCHAGGEAESGRYDRVERPGRRFRV